MKPLIFDFTEEKINKEEQVLHYYDNSESLSMIELNGLIIPFIDANPDDLNLFTQTILNQENDESTALLDLGTKTHGGNGESESA